MCELPGEVKASAPCMRAPKPPGPASLTYMGAAGVGYLHAAATGVVASCLAVPSVGRSAWRPRLQQADGLPLTKPTPCPKTLPWLQACVEAAAAAGCWADAARLADGGAPGLRRAAHLPRARALLARGRLAEARAALACAAPAPATPIRPQALIVRTARLPVARLAASDMRAGGSCGTQRACARARGRPADTGTALARDAPLGSCTHGSTAMFGAQVAY